MRFLLLTPGTGHFYCGSCLRDHALGNALRKLGHDVVVVPLYLPLFLEATAEEEKVRMGGINLYLRERSPIFRRLPRWLTRPLDHPRILRWASRRGRLTDNAALGEMTLSMLRGEHGRQSRDLDELVAWASRLERPDVVVLSNALLGGAAHRLREVLGCPVVMTLQGEAPFLEALGPHAEPCWEALRDAVGAVDAFVAVSQDYAETMSPRLAIDADRLHVVHNGLDVADYLAAPPRLGDRNPPTVGYLARMCADKGLPTLVDAFIALRGRLPEVRLRIAGAQLTEDRRLVAEQARRLDAAGLGAAVEFLPNVDRAEKLAVLRTLSVLSVPATYGESFGLYLLEAMASGVPVVQPRHGAFPEIVAETGGGVLCAPDDPVALADALEGMLSDPVRAQGMADRGRQAVLERFTAERMADGFVSICRELS